MKCARCTSDNPAAARFCMQCGSALPPHCLHCQAELPSWVRFCPHCGRPVGPPVSQPALPLPGEPGVAAPTAAPTGAPVQITPLTGERRQATIIMADVKGSTDLSDQIDVETWVEIMNHVFQVLGTAIYRYGGVIDQYRGDGLVAFFGTKATHEDDPERAVLAALEMQKAVHDYARPLAETEGVELRLRVGVNTGEVIAGTVGGRGQHTEDTAMGRAIALAARLESAAEPGTVQVSENTYRLVAPLFEWQPLGHISIKGFSRPQAAYRPLAHKPGAAKVRGIRGLESPLVGREAEIDALCRALERVQSGSGGIVTIVGEAGLGKSRLVAEVRKTVPIGPPSGLQWVEGRCLSYASLTAYQLWLDMHRAILNVAPGVSTTEIDRALRMWVQTLCPDSVDDVLPFVAQMMSLPLDPESQDLLNGLGADGLKTSTFRAIETVIKCAVQVRPVVVVCEDMHWADAMSMELLERLLGLVDHLPLLFICILRPVEDHACWQIREKAARMYRHRHTDILLAPLSDEQSQTLVENLLEERGLQPALQQAILKHAEGNPFYVEEVLRTLMQEGTIVQDEQTGHWTAVGTVHEIHLPDNLHGILMARVDRLDAECKRVLQLASVIGRLFDPRVLAAIVEEDTRQSLQQHLAHLQQAQMIRQRTTEPVPVYIFKHQLTQEAAYNSLLNRERHLYHRRVAQALEQLYRDRIQEVVELLAHHWEQAEELERVIHYLILAGDRARQMGASREALSFFHSAQVKAELRPLGQGADDLRLLHERMGDIYMENLSRYDKAIEHYRSFLKLACTEQDLARGARKVGSVHLLRGEMAEARDCFDRALACLDAVPACAEASRIHYGLASLSFSQHQLEAATEHARTSLEISQQVGDTRGMADAFRGMGTIAWARGESDTSHECHARSLALYRELGDLMRIVQACNNLGGSYQWRGEMDQALALFKEGLQLAQRIGDTRDEALLLTTTAELYLDQGRDVLAIEHLERALLLAQESGTVSRLIEAQWLLGVAHEQAGHVERARQYLLAAETQSRETSYLRFAPRIYLDLARLCAIQGQYASAQTYVEQAVEAAGPEPADLFMGHLHRCYGILAACRCDWDRAIEQMERSLAYFERTAVATLVGRTHLDLGAAYADRGRAGDGGRARTHLHAALATLHRIEADRFEAVARAQLEQLGPA